MEAAEAEITKILGHQPTSTYPADVTVSGKDFKAVLQDNVCYVTCAVLINDEGKILLTQEGFFPCFGQWYLPAGRVDPNETLIEGAKREVREETGIEFEPTTVLSVENPSGNWLRYCFTGQVTGGKLRTLAERDQETMQAQWWDWQTICEASQRKSKPSKNDMVLRGRDILPLIEKTRAYYALAAEQRPPPMLPVCNDHTAMISKIVAVIRSGTNSEDMHVLINKKGTPHLPTVQFHPRVTHAKDAIQLFNNEVYMKEQQTWKQHGLLGIEYSGRVHGETEGVCLTFLLTMGLDGQKLPKLKEKDRYEWYPLNDGELKHQIKMRLNDGMLVPIWTRD